MNLESVPRLPACVVAYALAERRDLRLKWNPVVSGGHSSAATLEVLEGDAAVVIRRPEGNSTRIRLEWRAMPRRGGRSLFLRCPFCGRVVRHLYSWLRTGNRSVVVAAWPCRVCAKLRYVLEGSWNIWRPYFGPPNRFPWDPEVRRLPRRS